MINSTDILQLCRLCLVEEEVIHPIFEESGDLRSISLKITSCLPVSIQKDDSLPKKICDSCSTKLDTFYKFWSESANAEKQLLNWLSENITSKQNNGNSNKKMEATEVKTEFEDATDPIDMSAEAQSYILQQQQLAYSSAKSDSAKVSESEEPVSKRPKRASAVKALQHLESEEEDDPDLEADNYAKSESEEEDESNLDNPSATSVEDQPGPSGITQKKLLLDDTPYLPDVLIPIIQLKEVKDEEIDIEESKIDIEETKIDIEETKTDFPEEKGRKKRKPQDKSGKGAKIRVKAEFRMKADDDEEKFECPICRNDVKRNLKEMKAHYKSDHQGKRLRTGNLTNESHPCDICGRELKHKSALREHIEIHNNSYSCSHCGVNHKKPVDHVIHMRSHSETETFSCIFCDYTTTELLEIQKHMSGDHERTQKYHCKICNKGFQIFSWFLEHDNFHTGLKPFSCEFCGKCFLYSRYLSAHRSSMHKEELTGVPNIHECVICKKQYQHKNSLNLHMNIHTGNVAICDICGKILSSKEKLKFHQRTHTGYKPFSCSYCGKSFTKKPILVEHVRVHTGERPYVCEYCNKCFSQRSSLVIHIRSHTGERPYVCQFCQKGFVAKAMLNIHLKSCKGMQVN